MPDRIQIVNIALAAYGGDKLDSFEDGTTVADLAAAFYEPCVKAVLEAHPWRFAGRVASLAPDTTAAHPRYDYSYQLPTDCVAVRALLDSDGDTPSDEYEIFGLKICTNLEPVAYAEYTYRAPEQYFSAGFVLCLARLLQHYLMGADAEDQGGATVALKAYQMELARAASKDSMQDSPRAIVSDDLVSWHHG